MNDSRVILITGASSGFGEATARLFAKEGYRVAVAARRFARLQALADELQAEGGTVLPIEADLVDLDSIQRMVNTVMDTWGQVDILFNNAGMGRLDWLDNLDPVDDIETQVKVNLLAVIQTTRVVLPYMIQQKRGHIINMVSLGGWIATPTYTIYAATKFGVRGFTEALRREVGVYGIHVSAIYPGGARTEFTERAKIQRKTGYTTPKALKLEKEDVARAVLKIAGRPNRAVVLPSLMWFSIWMNILFPGLVDRVIEKRFTIPERIG
jgi:uncharacterized protein